MTTPSPHFDEGRLIGSSGRVTMRDVDPVDATKTQTPCPQTHRAPSAKTDGGFRGC